MADPPISSRRDFLAGRSAISALEQLRPEMQAAASAEFPAAEPSSYLIEVSRTAMACQFEVLLNAGQFAVGPDAALRALDLVEQLEQQLSVYRSDSQIAQLNGSAATAPQSVESRLFDLLQQAIALWRATDGAFDVTSGPLIKAWGFYRRAGRVPSDAELAAARAVVGSQWLQLDPDQHTVQFLRNGMEINLGAIGKGYALDRCAQALRAEGVDSFLLHGGASSVVASGSRQGAPADRPSWSVALRHPLRPERRLAEFYLRDRALGTSGSANQYFFHEGRRLSHIIDPRNGRPAEQVLSATVLAPTAAEADALSTAFFVGGKPVAAAYCQTHPEISAVLVLPGGSAAAAQMVALNLCDDQWRIWDE